MKVEYDPKRDLLYLWLKAPRVERGSSSQAAPGTKATRTETIAPGVHADFGQEDDLIGLEVLDASEVLQDNVQFEVDVDVSGRPLEVS